MGDKCRRSRRAYEKKVTRRESECKKVEERKLESKKGKVNKKGTRNSGTISDVARRTPTGSKGRKIVI